MKKRQTKLQQGSGAKQKIYKSYFDMQSNVLFIQPDKNLEMQATFGLLWKENETQNTAQQMEKAGFSQTDSD